MMSMNLVKAQLTSTGCTDMATVMHNAIIVLCCLKKMCCKMHFRLVKPYSNDGNIKRGMASAEPSYGVKELALTSEYVELEGKLHFSSSFLMELCCCYANTKTQLNFQGML